MTPQEILASAFNDEMQKIAISGAMAAEALEHRLGAVRALPTSEARTALAKKTVGQAQNIAGGLKERGAKAADKVWSEGGQANLNKMHDASNNMNTFDRTAKPFLK